MDKERIKRGIDKFNITKRKLLIELFDKPVERERKRMLLKFGQKDKGRINLDDNALNFHLQKFRFRLFSLYCGGAMFLFFLLSYIISFWYGELKG
ncbi:hypothetical protein [Bacillus safensis]|uniref:Uncharacterized protein n=1 Tax=Bacillus safensis TaxID=561879 RepID=A0A1L6ZPB8_BACIA|nr:hypothetical protein [Bacillus safensis]APT48366.1 hypothetical protein BSA145_21110 [Bacillus safensis]